MQVRRGGTTGVSCQPDHLPWCHGGARLHENAGQVPVHRLIVLWMVKQDEQSVLGILAELMDGPAARRPDDASRSNSATHAGMCLLGGAGADLPSGDIPRLFQRPPPRY